MSRFSKLSWALGAAAVAGLFCLASDAQVRSDFSDNFYVSGHADIGVEYDSATNSFDLHYHFGPTAVVLPGGVPATSELDPDEVTTIVPDIANVTRFVPTTTTAGFFGETTATLSQYWVLLQGSLGSAVRPFLGFGAEDLPLGPNFNWSVVTYSLVGVSGPGEVAVWSTSVANNPNHASAFLWMSSAGGPSGSLDVDAGGHSHYHIGFSQAGVYDVTFRAAATLNGSPVTGTGTFRFNVVPEPSSFALVGLGLGGLLFARTFRRRGAGATRV